jgi:fatty-acyl-CoA synthase
MILPLTPLRFLERAGRLYSGKVGIICGGERFTYAAFFDRCRRLAGALLHLGARPGDRVAFLSPNCHRLLEAYYGVLLAKAVLLPLNIRLAPAEIAFIVQDADARILFLDPEYLALVDGIREKLPGVTFILLDDAPGSPAREARRSAAWVAAETYDELLAKVDPVPFDFMNVDDAALAELFYTSGTSGDPKGVMLSHRTVYLHALSVIAAQRTTDCTVHLHTIPLFHANGWGCAHSVTAVGGTHVLIRKFDPAEVCGLVEAHRVSTFSMVPTMATVLVNSPEPERHNLSSLTELMIGGAAASAELIRQLERKLGRPCYVGYGLTETSPVLTLAYLKDFMLHATPEEKLRYQSSTGHSIVGVEVRVVDENGRDVPQDCQTMGEVVARGDGIMDGYWKHPEETKKAFRDGWFCTGDMAVWGRDGYLLIVDRKKEIIISGGENISSIEIEKALIGHPSVYECAVIAVPDELWGEAPKAFIVLKPNWVATAEELAMFLKDRLAKYKIPHSFEFVRELPKGGTGKILKKVLREKFWAGQAKRVH